MESSRTENATPEAPTSYRWESPSRQVVVLLDFDVVDQLNYDVMKGFGAVPRRGAEVGGVLLGSVETGEQTTIRIKDFVAAACQHARGPSFILSESDVVQLDAIVASHDHSASGGTRVVGLYRSNTRDALELAPEDLSLLEMHIPSGGWVALLIKPFATRIAEAALFVKEDGHYGTGAAEPFPFRRKEMGGGASKPPRISRVAAAEPVPAFKREPEAAMPLPPVEMPEPVAEREPSMPHRAPSFVPLEDLPAPAPPPPPYREVEDMLPEETAPSRFRSGWIWIPLSFIFLLLGVVLGFQIAISFRGSKPPTQQTDPYSMDLTASKFGESLQLKWNLDSIPVSQAQRGVLTIRDGPSAKIVELNREDLARGSVLYRNLSDTVQFRLEVYPRERNSVIETIEVKVASSASNSNEAGPEGARKARQK